ncbi:MAG: hypothetical protein R2702_04600 [Acidimicrobiales bacterium]
MVLAVGLLGARAEAQYIPELPTTTSSGVLPGDVDRGDGHGVGSGGDLPVTGMDAWWLARAGAGLLVAGGMVLLGPARRGRRRAVLRDARAQV